MKFQRKMTIQSDGFFYACLKCAFPIYLISFAKWEDITCKHILVLLKQFSNILATQNQNHNQNWPFLTKDMNYFSFTLSG
jgi:hypothetical protein